MNKWKPEFEPSTATELMLINKIRQLEYKMKILSFEKGIDIYYDKDKTLELSLPQLPPTLNLPYCSEIRNSINANTGKLEVRVITHFYDNPKCFGSQFYVDPLPKNKYDAQRYTSYLLKDQMNELAKFLEKP